MLVLVATMIGCALFSYGLQTRLDELPDRAEKLEARLTDFETSLTTTNTALASTAACTAGVTTSVSINYRFYRSRGATAMKASCLKGKQP